MESNPDVYWTPRRVILILCTFTCLLPPRVVYPAVFGCGAVIWREQRGMLILCLLAVLRVFSAYTFESGLHIGAELPVGERIEAVLQAASSPRPLDARGYLVTLRVIEVQRLDGSSFSSSGVTRTYVRASDLPSYVTRGTEASASFRWNGETLVLSSSPRFSPPGGGMKELLEKLRREVRGFVMGRFSRLSWETGLLGTSLLLGIPFDRRDALFEACRTSGVAHVTALSGLHAAILVHMISLLLTPIAGRKGCRMISMVLLAGYLWFIGPRESLVRAVIMYWTYSILMLTDSKPDTLDVLSWTSLVHLLMFPSHGGTFSFMLSYGALAGIVLLAGIFNDMLPSLIPPSLRGAVSLTLSASCGTFPVLLVSGNAVYPAGIILSIPSIMLVTLFMWGCLVYLAFPGLWGIVPLLESAASLLSGLWKFGSEAGQVWILHPLLWLIPGSILLTRSIYLQYRSCRREYAGIPRPALRFPHYDQGTADDAGLEHDQAAGPEFPH